jgi:hypothetical protein
MDTTNVLIGALFIGLLLCWRTLRKIETVLQKLLNRPMNDQTTAAPKQDPKQDNEEGAIRVGIGMDEPIEVAPGEFRTARSFMKNARDPEELDEKLRLDSQNNPELAKVLEQHFGWKNGTPAGTPVVTQLIDKAVAESDYIASVIRDEPFEVFYQQGVSSAVKLAISKTNKVVLSPAQAKQCQLLLDQFLEAKSADNKLLMTQVYCALRDFELGYSASSL